MASDDVGLKLCQQRIIKLDLEIKAIIQVLPFVQTVLLIFHTLPG